MPRAIDAQGVVVEVSSPASSSAVAAAVAAHLSQKQKAGLPTAGGAEATHGSLQALLLLQQKAFAPPASPARVRGSQILHNPYTNLGGFGWYH